MKKIVLLAALAGTASAAFAQNTGGQIADGSAQFFYGSTTTPSTAALPTTSSSGGNVTMGFYIDGAVVASNRQVFSGNWYYRTAGDTRERHFASAVSRTVTGNVAQWGFGSLVGTGNAAIANTSSTMAYSVTDTGVDSAALWSGATFFNNTGADLSIDIFFAIDIDLGGSFGGDAYQALSTADGNRQWTVTDGTWTALFRGDGAHGAGVGGFSAINGQMTDTSVDNFIPDLNAGGAAAADNAAVMQWRVVIPAGGSFSANAHLDIGRNGVIPTPAAAGLLGMGMLAAGRRRRA